MFLAQGKFSLEMSLSSETDNWISYVYVKQLGMWDPIELKVQSQSVNS